MQTGEKLIYSALQIKEQVSRLGFEINLWAKEAEAKTGSPVLAVCVLSGGIFFYTDLLKALDVSVEMAFCFARTYEVGNKKLGGGKAEISVDGINSKGRAVLIIDDICDTGSTLENLLEIFRKQGAVDIRSVVLVHRERLDDSQLKPSWSGFLYKGSEWFFGYGFDDRNGQRRNLPCVYTT